MRPSCLAQDISDLADTTKHLAQRMSEPRESDFVPLKRAARYQVWKPKAVMRFRRQEHVDKNTVFVDSDFARDPVWRQKYDGTGGADWESYSEISDPHCESLTALSVGEAESYGVVEGGQSLTILEIWIYMNLGIHMKVEIRSDSSTANSLTDRLGAGLPNETHWYTIFSGYMNEFKTEISVSKKFLTTKSCADVGNEASFSFSTTTALQICRVGILQVGSSTDHGVPHSTTR